MIQWSFRVSLLSAVTSGSRLTLNIQDPILETKYIHCYWVAYCLDHLSIVYHLSIIYHLKGKIPNESKRPLSIQI